MRIFLLRPFILVLHRIRIANGSNKLETSVEEMVAKNTLDQVTNTCLAATEELIDLIWERTMNATNDLSFAWSWWYNVFCKGTLKHEALLSTNAVRYIHLCYRHPRRAFVSSLRAWSI